MVGRPVALLDRRAVRLHVGEDRPPPALPTTDPCLRSPARSGRGQLERAAAAAGKQLVSFRNRLGAGEVVVHPLGELGVRQPVLPLGIELDLFAGGVPSGERRFSITKAFLGGDRCPDGAAD